MTAVPSIDMSGWLHEQLEQAPPDLLRGMVRSFAQALMSAEADAVCGAGYGERSDERRSSDLVAAHQADISPARDRQAGTERD